MCDPIGCVPPNQRSLAIPAVFGPSVSLSVGLLYDPTIWRDMKTLYAACNCAFKKEARHFLVGFEQPTNNMWFKNLVKCEHLF